MPNKDAFNKIIRGSLTKKAKLEWLSTQTGQPVEAIQHLLDVKGRKGFKILGKRFGSNIDSLAGYLHELSKEHSRKKPGRSKRKVRRVKDIRPFKKQLNIKIHPITIKSLKALADAHEIPYKVIENALKAGAPLKTLLKMLESEEIPSERIYKHLVDKTKQKMELKQARSAIKPYRKVNRKKLKAEVDATRKKLNRLTVDLDSKQKKQNRLRNKLRALDRRDYQFKTLREGANEFPNQNLTNPSGTNRLRKMGIRQWLKEGYAPSPTTQLLRGPLTTNQVAKATRLMIGAGRTIKNLGAGYALHAASDAFIAPHARRAGEELAERALIPLGRRIDKLRIRKKKK